MGPLEIKGAILVLAMVGGIASLWIGYRLYFHGVIEKGRINLTAPGSVKITLSDYGPGVAFWAIGVLLMIFAVTRPLSSNESKTTRYIPAVEGTATAPAPASTQPRDGGMIIEEQTSADAAAATYPPQRGATATDATVTRPAN